MSGLLKIVFWLWPPYEERVARKVIDSSLSGSYQERMKSIQAEISKSLPEDAGLLEESESLAKLVFESESERNETLESKALAFVSAFGVTVSVVSALPALFSEKWNISTPAALIVGVFYGLAIIHLLMAAYYAIDAKRVAGFALPNADEFVETLQERRQSVGDRIVMFISQAKFNQPILLKKANSLWVAESMFIRGLLFVAIASLISASTMLFIAGFIPAEICEVPDVVGLHQVAAERMLTELELQPVRSNQYDPSIIAGVVISQDPPAGSRMKPCHGDVTIVISLGPLPTPSPTSLPTNTLQPSKTPTPISLAPTPMPIT
jgi:hypothetical protein